MLINNPLVAVVGAGYWGKNLIRNTYQLGALKLVCERSEALLSRVREQYPDVETSSTLDQALQRDDISALVIATPAETHHQIAKEALLAGKHVFVEKPLALDESDAEELIAIAQRQGVVLMVGHLLQYHPAFIRLKSLVLEGELGRINYIYSNRLNLGKIRREENILWSFAPHDVSMILSLAGEEPETVMAIGGCYLHQKIADVSNTHFCFASGLSAHIFVSWLHPFKEQKLIVVGERKMAVFDDTQPWEDKLLLYPHEIKWENNIPVPSKAKAERVEVTDRTEPLRKECEHFLDCVSQGVPPITDGAEGLRVLKILNASQRSLDLSGQPVRLAKTAAPPPAAVQPVKKNKPSFYVHETAVIDPEVQIGEGVKIWHFSHVLSHSTLGKGSNIGQNVVIGPDVTIGERCKIQNNVSVYKGVTLEDGVFCGPSMVFTNIYNPRAEISKMDQVRPTLVKRGATLGANCTIVCGVTIGKYAFVGAGAVVTRDVPDHALVVGNPAKQIGWMCECGERADETKTCSTCAEKRRPLMDEENLAARRSDSNTSLNTAQRR